MARPTTPQQRNLLVRICNRQTLTFCFFLALSVIFWIITKLNGTYQQEFAIPLELEDVPAEVVVTTDPPKDITVTIKDKGWALLSYRYGKGFKPIRIKFSETTQTGGVGAISSAEILRQVSEQVADDGQIVSIRPQQIGFYFNYGEKKRVPVKIVGDFASANAQYVMTLLSVPDSVVAYARAVTLDTLAFAPTEKLILHDLSDTLTIDAKLDAPIGVKFVPAEIKVRVSTDRIIERKVDVAVQQANFPAEKTLRTFPGKVNVSFQVGMQQYRKINADDFIIVVTYDELLRNEGSRIHLSLKSVPDGVRNVKIVPEEVEYVVEDIGQNGNHPQ